ncbi:MAG: replication factor [Thermoproteota archaeon]|nr:replication factor [Thermoproteota archaeon]
MSEGAIEGSRPQPVEAKIGELTPNSKAVNVTAKVVSKSEVRNTTNARDYTEHKVADALVGDETGCIYLSLWDDNIEKVKEGDTLNIKNGYISLLRGSMRLSIGRYGSFEIVKESQIKEVNTENNLSNKQYEQERRFERYGGGGSGGYRGGQRGYGDRRSGDYQRRRY